MMYPPSGVVVCLISICDRADTNTAAHEVGGGGEGGSREEEVAGGIRVRMAAQKSS